MGNKIGRRRQVVDERYTMPQGFYHHKDIDYKKLRKLILEFKLAPCYPGEEEPALDLEECPICFMYYPSLNRSTCCMKGICTECYLRMKPQIYAWPTQCPFCKFSNYVVEYRGVRTKEEKGLEELEEQKVIEAQIRRRQQELQDEEERTLKGNEMTSLSRTVMPTGTEYMDIPSCSLSEPSLRNPSQCDKSIYSQGASSMTPSKRGSHSRQNREDTFDLDFEEIMLMDAIWLSVQEQGLHQTLGEGSSSSPLPSSSGYYYDDPAESSSGGFACTAAAMAGRSYHPESWAEASPESASLAVLREGEWALDYGSEVAEAGTSYAESDVTMDVGSATLPSIPNGVNFFSGPESFEEQMMAAMAASRADIRARVVGLAWP